MKPKKEQIMRTEQTIIISKLNWAFKYTNLLEEQMCTNVLLAFGFKFRNSWLRLLVIFS